MKINLHNTAHQYPLTSSRLLLKAALPLTFSAIKMNRTKLNQIEKIIPGIIKRINPPNTARPTSMEIHKKEMILLQPRLNDSLMPIFSSLPFIACNNAVWPQSDIIIVTNVANIAKGTAQINIEMPKPAKKLVPPGL